MKIAVLGSGDVARALAGKFEQLGHVVSLGTRDPAETAGREAYAAWASTHPDVSLTSFDSALDGADLVVNAAAGVACLDMLSELTSSLVGKVLLDLSNPLDFSQGFPPTLFVKDEDSLAETIQRAHPEARVVKSLNTMAAAIMVDPASLGEPTTVFVSGDHASAKEMVAALLRQMGHQDVLDLGDLSTARGTEMLLPLWMRIMGVVGTGDFNLKIVRPRG